MLFVSLPSTGGTAQEYELCMSKWDAAQQHAERMKQEYTSVCHYFYTSCSRRYWNGHPKPLIDDVTFITPTEPLFRANATAVKIGNQCIVLLDEMEGSSK